MMIKKQWLLVALLIVQLGAVEAMAQTDDPPKREAAAEFSVLMREAFSTVRAEIGLGGRFTYNLNKNVALEGAGYYFPQNCFDCVNNGNMIEVVGGIKAGKRFEKWGVFAKARPGFVRFSQGQFDILPGGTSPAFPFTFQVKPLTSFATDVGAVLEFYPSRHIVTRFDAGDTIIKISDQTRNDLRFDPATNTYTLVPGAFTIPVRLSHKFQFSASVGYRW
jgi:hypothetical protein